MSPLRSNWFGRKPTESPQEETFAGNISNIDDPEAAEPVGSTQPEQQETKTSSDTSPTSNGGSGGGNEPPTPPDSEAGDGGDGTLPPTGNEGNHAMGLDLLVQGLQHAAFSANQYMTHQYIVMLSQLFTQNSDGSYTADYAELRLDDNHHINVPLVTLAPPRNLAVDKMVMRLTVRGDATETVENLTGQGERGHFKVTMAPHSGAVTDGRDSRDIDIEVNFIAQEPPEAVMRLLDEFIHRMTPIARQENRNEPSV